MHTTGKRETLYDEVKEIYLEDMKEKNCIKRSANSYAKRRHGPVHLSSDYLSSAEWCSRNGEVKTYRIGKPMTFAEFDILPNDIKRLYIESLRGRYGATNKMIAEMLGIDVDIFMSSMRLNGISILERKDSNPNIKTWCSFINGGAYENI